MENLKERIELANSKALQIILDGQPTWVDVVPAGEFIADLPENMILHAGPPLSDIGRASKPFRIAIGGAAVHEGLASDLDEAWNMIEAGEILLGSQLDHRGASGAAYAVTRSTPVQIVENMSNGQQCFCTFNEGASTSVLRWAVYNDEVEQRLRWFCDVLGPILGSVLRTGEGINIRTILSKAITMGDENHSRQVASTALLMQQLLPMLIEADIEHGLRREISHFLAEAERFFLHVFIAAAASVMEGLKGIDYSTIMVGQGGNGDQFGTKFAFSGNDWYCDDCPVCQGMYLNPDWDERIGRAYLGDSCVVETYGFGGNAAAAGPMVLRLTGGDWDEALERTELAREISVGTLDWAPIPAAGFTGPAVGFDMRKVVATGITPIIHGGMHHKDGGQAGAGSCHVPLECFKSAMRAFAIKYGL
ncbi:MAG: DUF1116 domain-containing protein [Desulfocapsaceae bacterium]